MLSSSRLETILAQVSPFPAWWNKAQPLMSPFCRTVGFLEPVGSVAVAVVFVGALVVVPGTPTQ